MWKRVRENKKKDTFSEKELVILSHSGQTNRRQIFYVVNWTIKIALVVVKQPLAKKIIVGRLLFEHFDKSIDKIGKMRTKGILIQA